MTKQVFSGGVVGAGEDAEEEPDEESGADRPGVDSNSAKSSSASAAVGAVSRELRVRLAALSEDAEDPEDSSKDRLGERCTRSFMVDGTNESTWAENGNEGACVRYGVGGEMSA